MEPMIMIPAGQEGAGGYREHDILVITEQGTEDITRFPFGRSTMSSRNSVLLAMVCRARVL
jgi:creatinase